MILIVEMLIMRDFEMILNEVFKKYLVVNTYIKN